MPRIAIFASGTGSNARKIIEYFKDHPSIQVGLVVSNKPTAPVLDMAASHGVETMTINRTDFYESEDIVEVLQIRQIDLIVLAGFLWLIPAYFVNAFAKQIINIHPALLPKYGGKGMYGMHVHRAVEAAGENESGITIHFVNEQYDDGAVIFQTSCAIDQEDKAEQIAAKVLQLEHQYFASTIEQLLQKSDRS